MYACLLCALSKVRLYVISDGRTEVKKKYCTTVKKHAGIIPDWQTGDPTTAVFTAEYAKTGCTVKRREPG